MKNEINDDSLPSKSASLFHTAIKNSKIAGIFIMDKNGIILEINPGVVKFFGYTEKDVIGKNFSLLFTKEDKKKGLPQNELLNVLKDGSTSDTNYVVHKDGTYIWVHGESILGKDDSDEIYIIKVIYDMSVQHALEKKLISLNNDLNNFVYTTSHDLKGPINNIEGLLNMLKSSIKENENPSEIIAHMESSVKKFKGLLNELAVIGKGRELEGKGECALIQFKDLTEEVIDNLQIPIEKANATINYDFSLAPEIDFSKNNLRSVIHNLLSNAVKYNDPNRKLKINIYTEKYGEYVVFKIKDNGLGIKKSDRENLFTFYKRFHSHVEGTGVGLAIVRRIMENSGGKVEVESKEGVGSIFCVYFKIMPKGK